MTDDILRIARTLCGVQTEDEALRAFCSAAEAALTARLRCDAAECRDSFLCAAAMLAASYYLSAAAAGTRSFTAGTLTVSRAAEDAERLAGQAETLLKPYFRDDFAFMGA